MPPTGKAKTDGIGHLLYDGWTDQSPVKLRSDIDAQTLVGNT